MQQRLGQLIKLLRGDRLLEVLQAILNFFNDVCVGHWIVRAAIHFIDLSGKRLPVCSLNFNHCRRDRAGGAELVPNPILHLADDRQNCGVLQILRRKSAISGVFTTT